MTRITSDGVMISTSSAAQQEEPEEEPASDGQDNPDGS